MEPISKDVVANFYDQFSTRQQRDFVFGNARVHAAIERLDSIVDSSTQSILDIGCGCGQLAWEYATKYPTVEVLGLDISPRNIEVAQALFDLPNLSYAVSDLSEPPAGRFDIVAMIDVYEHIPQSDRATFNENVAACISEQGALLLTTPTPMYQKYLAEHAPEELQIIDEIVELADLLELAKATDTEPTLFEYVQIWKKYDYTHFIATKSCRSLGPRVKPTVKRSIFQKLLGRIEAMRSVRARKQHVRQKLGIEVRRA